MTHPLLRPRALALEKLFRRKRIATLTELQLSLGSSARTALRALSRVGYLTSYSHAGRYYTLSRIPTFDATGLWFHGDVCFSRLHTLRATVVVVVKQSPAGHTHEELQALLRLRVHDTLRSLVADKALSRERVTDVYVYLHPEADVAGAQLARRRELAVPSTTLQFGETAHLDALRVIDVLVAVILAPKDDACAIAARLQARGIALSAVQIEEVFKAYGLEKKNGAISLATLAALRKIVSSLLTECGRQLQSTAGALVVANDPAGPCPRCGGATLVRKTFEHGGRTLAHGDFRVRETVHVCATGCTQPEGESGRSGALVKRQAAVAELLLPRSTVGYDVMTFVGLARFVQYRQRDEIRVALAQQHHVVLSSGEVSALGRRFLVYLEALHQARSADLRIALEQDGGWPLHIDATGEDGQGTLLVAYAGWRGWALGAWKIPTERADAILPKMHAVAATFGAPCAVMRDLGRAVIEAARDFVAELDDAIPVLSCHLHFVKDIGKDLLCASHDNLRNLFRRFKVRPRLRTLARDLGRSLSTEIAEARDGATRWLAGTDERFLLPDGNVGLAVVRALTQWVLDYADDGTDAGFPFDRPYLDLYRRCHRACRAAESLLRKPHNNPRAYQAIERLHRVIEPVRSELPFEGPARILQSRARLFDELRDALRLQVKPPSSLPAGVAGPRQQAAELRDVKEAVEALQTSLRDRRPERGPAQDTRLAIDLILRHIERHGPSLWGHVIALPPEVGGGIRLVARTNVLIESFFHTIKHGERRRSGRKVLSQDFQHLPAAAALARNLVRADYVALLCGSLENLPHAFAQLDAPVRSLSLAARLRAPAGRDDAADIVSSSLPKADRHLVRTAAMQERVMAESRTRAPRRYVARVNE